MATLCFVASLPISAQPAAPVPPSPVLSQQAVSVPSEEIRGLQSVYLGGPIQRFYVDAPVSVGSVLRTKNIELPYLSIRRISSLNAELERTQRRAGHDKALAAFFGSTKFGPILRGAFDRATLYISLPQPGQPMVDGYRIVNNNLALNKVDRARKATDAPLHRRAGARVSSTDKSVPTRAIEPKAEPVSVAKLAGPEGPPPAAPYSVKAETKIYAGEPVVSRGAKDAPTIKLSDTQIYSAEILLNAIQSFTAFVSLDSQCKSATLYVLGSMPATANADLAVNFTVEGLRYAVNTSVNKEKPEAVTLIDKQNLLPAERSPNGDASRYFCFEYPLKTPINGVQENFLISFWYAPTLALTHGIALAHIKPPRLAPPATAWVAIPMTRMQRTTQATDYRYQALEASEPGDTLTGPDKVTKPNPVP